MKIGLPWVKMSSQVGGGYTFFEEVVCAIDRNASQTAHKFCALGWEAECPKQLEGSGIDYCCLQEAFKLSLSEKIKRKIYREKKCNPVSEYLKKTGIDLIVNLVVPLLMDKLSEDIPYVHTVWDLQHRRQPYFPEVSSNGEWTMRERILKESLQRAAAIIVGTAAGKREVEHFYGVHSDRFWRLPLPVPSDCLNKQMAIEKVNEAKEKFGQYVLYPAQFWAHKNHVAIIDAIGHLNQTYNLQFNAVFVGSDQGNKAYVLKYAQDRGIAGIHYLGFVPREDLIALYQAAHALTFVSHFGPDNIPPLEAFALGCPVIAAKVDGADEQLGDAALLVDPSEPRELADAIAKLHHEPAMRSELSRRGRLRSARWTTKEFVIGLFQKLDDFEKIRRCWGAR